MSLMFLFFVIEMSPTFGSRIAFSVFPNILNGTVEDLEL